MNTEVEVFEFEAPVFTPQPQPPGLGILRSIILVLMVMVGFAEALLIAGIALNKIGRAHV